MKNIVAFLLLFTSFLLGAQAQQRVVQKTLNVPANKNINLNLRFANDIKITAWDKKEASVKITYEINSGKLNDALLLTFESDSESARVKVDYDKELMRNGKAEDCPDNNRVSYSTYKDGPKSYTCSTINYEIFVPRDANLTVETLNGDIELKNLTGPVHAKSISGFVDMNWADNKGAEVSLKTITGEVYSDLKIDFLNKQKNIPTVGYQLKGHVNGGGSAINLESISNNIYFRKQN